MKILLTDAEVNELNGLYIVVYKERILVTDLEFEQALMIAVDRKQLDCILNPKQKAFIK